MKQYTTREQTAKLIELGFDTPRGWCIEGISSCLIMYKHKDDDEGFNYSIGELIEIMGYDLYSIHYKGLAWEVKSERVETRKSELIDALFDMIVKLKEEGVI